MKSFYTETLPDSTLDLVNLFQLRRPAFLDEFYLSAGTALSLQIGHRESEDLDFFTQNSFKPDQLQSQLANYGDLKAVEFSKGTLNGFINGVKLQFIEYPYLVIEPYVEWDGIKLSSVLDIACTKLQTISSRGSKKDFIDLYFILDSYSLPDLFEYLEKKYQKISYNKLHILKSLVYFDDADGQPMPRMHKKTDWKEVKEFIATQVKIMGSYLSTQL